MPTLRQISVPGHRQYVGLLLYSSVNSIALVDHSVDAGRPFMNEIWGRFWGILNLNPISVLRLFYKTSYENADRDLFTFPTNNFDSNSESDSDSDSVSRNVQRYEEAPGSADFLATEGFSYRDMWDTYCCNVKSFHFPDNMTHRHRQMFCQRLGLFTCHFLVILEWERVSLCIFIDDINIIVCLTILMF